MILSEQIKKASGHHRLFQCLIIILSNHRAGIKIDENFKPQMVFKHQGGVVVNGREIVVNFDEFDNKIYCYDDWNDNRQTESDITEKSIIDLLSIDWNNERTPNSLSEQIKSYMKNQTGVEPSILTKIIENFIHNPYGDPLRSLFQL
jgi:Zn-dependent metalloprotease